MIHDDNLDSIWDGDDSELWSYEKVYEMTGQSLENKRQREQEEYDKAEKDMESEDGQAMMKII